MYRGSSHVPKLRVSEVRIQMTEDRRVRAFEDLEVFQRAYRLSLEIHRATLQMPSEEQRGLCEQMHVWIRYCLDLGYIEEPTWKRWRDEYQDIAKMLQGLYRSWK